MIEKIERKMAVCQKYCPLFLTAPGWLLAGPTKPKLFGPELVVKTAGSPYQHARLARIGGH
jgi:hypothetical protein